MLPDVVRFSNPNMSLKCNIYEDTLSDVVKKLILACILATDVYDLEIDSCNH